MPMLEEFITSGLLWYGPIIFLASVAMAGWHRGLCEDLRSEGFTDHINLLRVGVLVLIFGVIVNAATWGVAENYSAVGHDLAAAAAVDASYASRPVARISMLSGLGIIVIALARRPRDVVMSLAGVVIIAVLAFLYLEHGG